jgi:hypothetical protein
VSAYAVGELDYAYIAKPDALAVHAVGEDVGHQAVLGNADAKALQGAIAKTIRKYKELSTNMVRGAKGRASYGKLCRLRATEPIKTEHFS